MVGPLRIYRVLGSVAFLSAGTLLRPILPKSQCWCVDGESKFVLRVATNMYYRIELPNTCQAENNKVEELKLVLAKVLRYELTPCPFKRGFTVELPEPPRTPVRLRPWQPRPRLRPVTLAGSSAAASKEFDDSDIQEREKGEYSSSENSGSIFESVTAAEYELPISNLSSAVGGDIDHHRETNNTISFAKSLEAVDYEEPDMFKTPIQPKPLRRGRNITAPHLSLRTPPPSDVATLQHPTVVDTRNSLPSGSSSSESFHSFHSPISPLPPSPPYSNPSSPFPNVEHDVLKLRRTRSFRHESSNVAEIGELSVPWDITNIEGDRSSPTFSKAPTLISDGTSPSEDPWPEAPTPSPSTQLRHRRQALPRRQTPSPLPLPANLYSPGCHLSGHHLTTAILQKTCSLLLGPPVQLVALMLNIAAKIARGAYRGASFGYGESGQKIPCSWDFSDAEDGEGNREDEGDSDSDSDPDPGWQEDDFGVAIAANLTNTRNTRLQKVGSAWEID